MEKLTPSSSDSTESRSRQIIQIFQSDNKSSWFKGLQILPQSWQNASDLLVASTVINILSLALPLTLMQVYDRILTNQALSTLAWLVIGCSIALLLETAIRLSRSFISAWMAARFEHLVGCSAIEAVLASDLETFEKDEVGIHLDRINAISVLRGFYAGQVFQIILDLPFSILFLVAIAYLAGPLVLFPIAVVLVFLGMVGMLRLGFIKARKFQLDLNDRRSNFIIELLIGVHFVKAMTTEERMMRRYERLQSNLAETNMKVSFWEMLPINFGVFFSQVTMFGIIWFGSNSVIEGALTVGGLTACTILGGRALQPIQSIAGFWLRFSNAQIAQSKLRKVSRLAPQSEQERPPFPKGIAGSLKIENASYRYRGTSDYLLKDINLEVEARETIGIMGEDATRTSALLGLLIGQLKPEEGSVSIDDHDLAEWDTSNLQGEVEYVPQSGKLFNGTILENISMFNEKKLTGALEAASLLGLDDLIAQLPMGYETVVGSQFSNFLPSGLIQRIVIARALVQRPRILLFDRANTSMDQDSDELVRNLIEKLKGVCTLVLVTNQPGLLSYVDTIYELIDDTLEDLF